jgi:hypothetical protein
MKKRCFIVLDIEADQTEGETLPSEETIRAALAHSTAAEALAEATGCTVCMELLTLDDMTAEIRQIL